MEDIKEKAIKGVSWSFIDNIANSGIKLAKIMEFLVPNSLNDCGFMNCTDGGRSWASID